MRESHTIVLERNAAWSGDVCTEPCETGWAREAAFFVRFLGGTGVRAQAELRVQVSPDGMHWCDEGTCLTLEPGTDLAWCRLREFGSWLRLVGRLAAGEAAQVMVYLQLKE